jgi:hypothetical protein
LIGVGHAGWNGSKPNYDDHPPSRHLEEAVSQRMADKKEQARFAQRIDEVGAALLGAMRGLERIDID